MSKKEKFEGLSIVSGLLVVIAGADELILIIPKLFQDIAKGNLNILFGSPAWDLLKGVLLVWIGVSIIKLTWKNGTKNL